MSPMLLVLCAVSTAVVAPPVVLLLAWLDWRAPEVLQAALGSEVRVVHLPRGDWDELGVRPRGTWTMAPASATVVRRAPTVGDRVELHPVVLAAPVRLAAPRR